MDQGRYSPAPQDVAIDIGHDPNEDRDANIFALGDAAANLDEDIDDLFSEFGLNLSDIVKDGAPSKITTKTVKVQDRPLISTPPTPSQDTVQVSTISQNFGDGRSVQTKIVKGPVRCKKRVVKISRETADGFEVLAEVEAPGDADINQVLATAIPHSLGISSTSSLDADYDNLDPGYGDRFRNTKSEFREDDWVGLEEDVERVRNQRRLQPSPRQGHSVDHIERVTEITPKPVFKPRGTTTSQFDRKAKRAETVPLVDKSDSSEAENTINQLKALDEKAASGDKREVPPKQNGDVQNKITRNRKSRMTRRRGSHAESIRKKSITQIPEDDDIQLYHPPDLQDESDDSDDGKSCIACRKRCRKKSYARQKSFSDMPKKKQCMTAMHPDIEGTLPGIKALVANYAKMLYEDRSQFVETMFRAVKLNNVDVTRILCKIVQKSGFNLSQFDLREPESSATILHVALLYNHENIVRMLLTLKDRDLVIAKYESYDYRNQTGLHLAVANENPEIIEEIVSSLEPHDRVALINTIADGKYFKTQHPDGQLCLTAAAWAGNAFVIKTLVRYGAELGLKNDSGNTLLHSVILQADLYPERSHYESLVECIWEACSIKAEQLTVLYDTKFQKQKELKQNELRENMFRELLKIRNNNGNTPLALAANRSSRLFKYLINMEKIFKIPQNKLGSIAWVTYDITDISSFAKNRYNKWSVLHILAHNSRHLSRKNIENEAEEDYLEMEPVSTIISNKWSSVYRWVYIAWMITHIIYMLVFTSLTVNVNSKPYQPIGQDPIVVEPELWLAFFMILPSIYMLQECLDIGGIKPYRMQFMTNQNYLKRCLKCLKSEWTITGNGPYRLVMFGFSSFTLQWYILYWQKDVNQDVALSMSLLLGWIFVLFFTRACRVTCKFTIMIQKMFFRDLIYFLTVYGIILVGFSFSMNALFTYHQGLQQNKISQVFYDMMNVVTDLDTKQTNEGSRHLMFSKLLLILYAIVAVILLMNMLIAMMNTSYETIRATRCNLCKQQQLSIMLMMERRFFFLHYVCKKSEGDVWTKDVGEDKETRYFLDVTMLNQPGIKDDCKAGDQEPAPNTSGRLPSCTDL